MLFAPSVAFSAGQPRGILWDSCTIQMWSKISSPRQEHSPGQTQHCPHRVVTGWSWLGARMGSTTGLARCTRRWLQKYLPKDLSGRDTTSSVLSSWMCCANMFSPCGLLLCSHSVLMVLSHWELWWNTILWEPWIAVHFLRHKRFRMKFKCGQKIGKGSYVPVPKDATGSI